MIRCGKQTRGTPVNLAVTQHGVHDPQLTALGARPTTPKTSPISSATANLARPPTSHPAPRPDHRPRPVAAPCSHTRGGCASRSPTQPKTRQRAPRARRPRPAASSPPGWRKPSERQRTRRRDRALPQPRPSTSHARRLRLRHHRGQRSATRVLSLLADEAHAVIHSDPAACLDRDAPPPSASTSMRQPAPAGDRTTARPLHLGRLRPRHPPPKLTPQDRRLDAPPSARRAPCRAAPNRTSRYPARGRAVRDRDARPPAPPRENPTQAARKAAAGIAWERVLIERVAHLSAQHDELTIPAERWQPPGVKLDLDLIVHDRQKQASSGSSTPRTPNAATTSSQNAQPDHAAARSNPELTDGRPRSSASSSTAAPARQHTPDNRAPRHPALHAPGTRRPPPRQAPTRQQLRPTPRGQPLVLDLDKERDD